MNVNDPFFIAETSGKFTSDSKQAWFREQADLAREKGSVFARASYHPNQPDRLLFEGWRERPDDQGDLRWSVAS